jgi:hypothetical protein
VALGEQNHPKKLFAIAFDGFPASQSRLAGRYLVHNHVKREVTMPAAKPKTKRTAKAKTRDNKLWRAWENDPDLTPEERAYMRDFFYRRRHLAVVADPCGGPRILKCRAELEETDDAAYQALKRIYERDGAEIFKEARRESLIGVLTSIEMIGGLPKPWRRMLKELVAEMRQEEARIDARLNRQRNRRGDRPAVAA